MNKINLVCYFLIFTIGLYYYMNYSNLVVTEESFLGTSPTKRRCPNLLIKKNNKIHLLNTDTAKVPGINPIKFNNLEEYVEFVKWLNYYKIDCPVLFLQQEYDIQDNEVYRIRPDLSDIAGGINGIPAGESLLSRGNNDYDQQNSVYKNSNIYAFNPDYIKTNNENPIDKMFFEKEKYDVSDNPMDSNWGGHQYTMQQIREGKYIGDEILVKSQ